MDDQNNDIKDKYKKFIRSDEDKDKITHEIVNSMPNEIGTHRVLTDMQIFDLRQLCVEGILSNLRRKQIMHVLINFLDEEYSLQVGKGLDVSEKNLINIYHDSRKLLAERTLSNIDEEKRRYVNDMYRIAMKCEQSHDYGNAQKALREMADLAGVFHEKDDSNITINFLPAKKKNNDE